MRIAIIVGLLAQLDRARVQTRARDDRGVAPPEVDGKPGAKMSLFVDVTPKPNIHVYAPGSGEFYIPITVKLEAAGAAQVRQADVPEVRDDDLCRREGAGVREAVPADAGSDARQVAEAGRDVVVAGTVNYQACDDKVCFPPGVGAGELDVR